MKICTVCKIEKSSGDFYKHPNSRDKLQSNCKGCSKNYHTNRNRTIRDNWRKYQFPSKYGITIDDYDQMMVDQNYKCAICDMAPIDYSLHVDHSHISGQVRGLLCRKCNVGLGSFGDSPSNLRNAANYLEKNQSSP